jgi:hypothetical protein
MATRAEFTLKISQLVLQMAKDGHIPVYDYLMRHRIEQMFFFELGRSKCDGIVKLSDHQLGCACDIYFVINGQICFDYDKSPLAKELAKKYHDEWVKMGGQPMIEWDKGHYAMKRSET